VENCHCYDDSHFLNIRRGSGENFGTYDFIISGVLIKEMNDHIICSAIFPKHLLNYSHKPIVVCYSFNRTVAELTILG
jgi:hypothetical protein